MRRDIRLYIDGQLADLDKDSFILFNYTFEELGNPSVVRNSYTQNVQLPATSTNNRIFDHLYKADRLTTDYNPLERTPFSIYSAEGTMLQRGYIKIDKMTTRGKAASAYNVTLFGGLGGFLYQLSADAEGRSRTLGDLYYRAVIDGEESTFRASTLTLPMSHNLIKSAWDYIEDSTITEDTLFSLINFAPAYNGKPSGDFDASKGVYKSVTGNYGFVDLVTSKDGYTTLPGADGYVLVDLNGERDEWQVQDLRSYFQRPVISVKGLLNAFTLVQNSGGYIFRLDEESFATGGNPWYEKGWITLPMVDRAKDLASLKLSDYLGGMTDPSKWLLGLAKIFGLQFVYDDVANTITLTARDTFFSASYNEMPWKEVVDLTGKVDITSIDIKPYTMSARYYDQSLETYGDFAKRYKEKYGRNYGMQRIDTGYSFDEASKNLLDGVVYKGAADVMKADEYFVFFMREDSLIRPSSWLKFPLSKFRLYKYVDGVEESAEFVTSYPNRTFERRYSLQPDYQIDYDTFPKVQLHDADGKGESGEGVLLFLDKVVDLPSYPSGDMAFLISDDIPAMDKLCGKPCWQLSMDIDSSATAKRTMVTSLPSFRRFLYEDGTLQYTMEMGDVREIGVPNVSYSGETYSSGHNIYQHWWRKFATDRYNVDSKVMTCKVDLSQFQVGQHLLRQFYHFGNSLWVLNKIVNHSLTTYDLTECEFIKVQDLNNYEHGIVL